MTTTEDMTVESLSLSEITSTVEITAEATGTAEASNSCEVTTIVDSRLRQSASIFSSTVAGVPNHTTLPVLTFEAGWYQVTYRGIAAWINASLVTPNENCG